MYKLLVTDLDGTLLDDSSSIPEGNKESVKLAAKSGVATVISSGRSYMSLNYFEEQLGLNKKGSYGICFNGSIVYEADTRTKLTDYRLNRDIAMDILKELRAFDVDFMIYEDKVLYAERETEEILSYRDRSKVLLKIIRDFESISENVSKILLKGENDELKRVVRHMDERWGHMTDLYNMFFSSKTLLEFGCPSVDKGTGLEYLLDHLGIDRSECIAVGDQENDISMIEAAGLGVAVRNAEDAVRHAADYITRATNNECAIQEIVERFLL